MVDAIEEQRCKVPTHQLCNQSLDVREAVKRKDVATLLYIPFEPQQTLDPGAHSAVCCSLSWAGSTHMELEMVFAGYSRCLVSYLNHMA